MQKDSTNSDNNESDLEDMHSHHVCVNPCDGLSGEKPQVTDSDPTLEGFVVQLETRHIIHEKCSTQMANIPT